MYDNSLKCKASNNQNFNELSLSPTKLARVDLKSNRSEKNLHPI